MTAKEILGIIDENKKWCDERTITATKVKDYSSVQKFAAMKDMLALVEFQIKKRMKEGKAKSEKERNKIHTRK